MEQGAENNATVSDTAETLTLPLDIQQVHSNLIITVTIFLFECYKDFTVQ